MVSYENVSLDTFQELLDYTEANTYWFKPFETGEAGEGITTGKNPSELVRSANEAHEEYPDWDIQVTPGHILRNTRYRAIAEYTSEGLEFNGSDDHASFAEDYEIAVGTPCATNPGRITLEGELNTDRKTIENILSEQN